MYNLYYSPQHHRKTAAQRTRSQYRASVNTTLLKHFDE